ncbi:MAG TPA: HAMP domain-containing sensor histidine kinase [Steroidobacteraceae bacterium]|jgi:signal transduction histidine kinase|nr:HAMP domain-containing sensor histidine kinase [Steroidobacteraceae bacterium]
MQPTQAAAPETRNEGQKSSLNGHGLHRAGSSGLAETVVREEGFGASDRHRLVAQINELSMANRRVDEFLAILSHELRSPLASIQHGIGVLRGPSGDDVIVQRGMHELIEWQVNQMRGIAAGLLDVARLTSGRLPLRPERLELRALLSNAIETLEPDFNRRTQALVASWPSSSLWVKSDADRVEQVFTTLLTNASKYTDVGGSVALSLSAQDKYAIVRIKDSGIGIAAHALPHIFDVFMQADAASARCRSGMGTGLALARRIVESHGGSVEAHSAGLGQGSEFIVRLPLEN